jgi:hypothetical protein
VSLVPGVKETSYGFSPEAHELRGDHNYRKLGPKTFISVAEWDLALTWWSHDLSRETRAELVKTYEDCKKTHTWPEYVAYMYYSKVSLADRKPVS